MKTLVLLCLIYVCLFFPWLLSMLHSFHPSEKEPSVKGEGKVCSCTHGRAIRSRVCVENRVDGFHWTVYLPHRIVPISGQVWCLKRGDMSSHWWQNHSAHEDLTLLKIILSRTFPSGSWLCSFMFVCLFFFLKILTNRDWILREMANALFELHFLSKPQVGCHLQRVHSVLWM